MPSPDYSTNQAHESGIDFRKLIENSYSGIILLNEVYTVIYRSTSVQRIVGWDDARVLGLCLEDVIHPDDTAALLHLLQTVKLSPNKPQTTRFRNRHALGHYIWLECTFTNMLHEPNVNAIVCNFIDITERLNNQEQLIESEQFIKTITDNLPAMIAYFTAAQRCLFANGPYNKWFGKKVQTVVGSLKQDLVDAEVFAAQQMHLQQVLSGIPQSFERRLVGPNGDGMDTHTQYIPDWKDGRVKGFYSLIYDVSEVRDISARMLAAEQVRQSNSRFALIAKASQDALFEWNLTTNKVWWSEVHYTMFGFDPSKPIPTQEVFMEKIHPDSRALFFGIFNDAVRQEISNWEQELTYLRPDQSWGTLLGRGFVVLNDHGKPARLLGSFIDITARKNDENHKELLTGISLLFKEKTTINLILNSVAAKIHQYGMCAVTEIWVLSADEERLVLTAKDISDNRLQGFFEETADVLSFVKGRGLPGKTWAAKVPQFWKYADPDAAFVRRAQAEKRGLKSAWAIPICHDDEVLGVLVLRFTVEENPLICRAKLFESLCAHLGMELKHHQLEQQLWLLFNRTPDAICIIGTDRHFKKANPAITNLLEYSEAELTGMSLNDLVYEADLQESKLRTQRFIAGGEQTIYFENRFVSRSGKVIWFSWTVSKAAEKDILFCVGKDISDKKEMELLLNKANELARIGSWEIDRLKNTVYWSAITREIHEVDVDFEPDFETSVGFYREGIDRRQLIEKVNEAIASGQPCDIELQIVTSRGNAKWVRVIAEAVYQDGQCVRVRGSFQDIDTRKRAEIAALAALHEKRAILESIGDGFFAVDHNWITTYWNTTAEKTMGRPRETMLGKYFWDLYPDVVELESYKQYALAMKTNQAVHFEDYYPPMSTWFGVSAYPSENGLSVFFRDITESKKTMRALEESEKRYSDLFQLSPIPMFVYDMDTLRYLDINMAAVQHYGFSRTEFLAMTLRDIRPPEDIHLMEATVSQVQDRKSVKQHGVFRHRKKNGEIIQVDIQSNIIDYQGIMAKVVLANDVTERMEYVKTIELQNQKLKEISWMQSHVVRAPLSRIMGLLGLIDSTENNTQDLGLIHGYILSSAHELDKVIRSITDVTDEVNPE